MGLIEVSTVHETGSINGATIEILNGNQLKRKRSISQSFHIEEQATPTINFCDTYLKHIKETLEKISLMNLKEESKLYIRLLCEKIKDKLETNNYENMSSLNDDLNQINDMFAQSTNESSLIQSSVPITANLIAQSCEISSKSNNILQAQVCFF